MSEQEGYNDRISRNVAKRDHITICSDG